MRGREGKPKKSKRRWGAGRRSPDSDTASHRKDGILLLQKTEGRQERKKIKNKQEPQRQTKPGIATGVEGDLMVVGPQDLTPFVLKCERWWLQGFDIHSQAACVAVHHGTPQKKHGLEPVKPLQAARSSCPF